MNNSNVYVDDTTQWEQGTSKKEVAAKLRESSSELYKWCEANKIKLQWMKTFLMFNRHADSDKIVIDANHVIHTAPTIKYLGAHLMANPACKKSTILIDMTEPATDIRRRCKLMRLLSQFKLPTHLFQQICKGFIGGKFNYYLPWIAGEMTSTTFRPMEIAYNDYMRTYTGAFISTPITLLHAMSGFPLRDKIISATTLTVLAARANGSQLGQDYSADSLTSTTPFIVISVDPRIVWIRN
jgi:hypothetical protein